MGADEKYAAAPVFRSGRVRDLAWPQASRWRAGTCHLTWPYLDSPLPLPGSSAAVAFTNSSANFRWLVSSFSAKS